MLCQYDIKFYLREVQLTLGPKVLSDNEAVILAFFFTVSLRMVLSLTSRESFLNPAYLDCPMYSPLSPF